jgi:hypothetical protein
MLALTALACAAQPPGALVPYPAYPVGGGLDWRSASQVPFQYLDRERPPMAGPYYILLDAGAQHYCAVDADTYDREARFHRVVGCDWRPVRHS